MSQDRACADSGNLGVPETEVAERGAGHLKPVDVTAPALGGIAMAGEVEGNNRTARHRGQVGC